MLKTIIEYKEF